MNRILVIAAIGCGLICASVPADAQTVESVLRALQERQMVLETRNTFLHPGMTTMTSINWPSGIEAFPQDGSITTLPDAIAALNAASSAFDTIKRSFLAYDTERDRFINLHQTADSITPGYTESYFWKFSVQEQSDNPTWIAGPENLYDNLHTAFQYAPIDLPSVGMFDETNWRDKLVILASNIDQLKAVEWPLLPTRVNGGTGTWDAPANGYAEDYGPQFTVSFPELIESDINYRVENSQIIGWDSANPGILQWDHYWNAFSWTLFGAASLDKLASSNSPGTYSGFANSSDLYATIGVQGKINGLSALALPPNAPTLDGRLTLFKGASIAQWGDLTEAVSNSEATGGALPLGTLTQIPFEDQGDGVFKAGTVSESADPVDISRSEATVMAFQWLEIPVPMIGGEMMLAPAPAEAVQSAHANFLGDYAIPYVFALDVGANQRRGYLPGESSANDPAFAGASINELNVGAVSVFVPQFTDILPDAAKKCGRVKYGIGEVVTSIANWERVQIHVGRGNTDLNQIGWLGTRPDAFGSLSFHGSPTEFEVLFEEDPTNYEDEPMGGRTFDSVLEFTDDQKAQSHWGSRWSYIAEWYSPRLRQVKGGDVLVDIHYPNCYRKVLDFYWAKDAGDFDGQFYSPNGDPFKTIFVENPTMPDGSDQEDSDPALPTEANHLQITEDEERYHDITFSQQGMDGNGDPRQEVFTFKVGDSPNAGEITRKMTTAYEGYRLKSLTIDDTHDGQSSTTTLSFAQDDSFRWPPLLAEGWPSPVKIVDSSSGDDRRIDLEWQDLMNDDNDYLYTRLSKLTYSGPNNWSENGKRTTLDEKGLPSSTERLIAGKVLKTESTWSGNTRTSTSKLNGSTFQTSTATYTNQFTKCELSTGGRRTTLTYQGQADEGQGDTSATPGSLILAEHPDGYRQSFFSSYGDDGSVVHVQSGWGDGFGSGTDSLIYRNRFGELLNRTVQTTEGVTLDSAVGSDFTAWGAPRTITTPQGDLKATYYEQGLHVRKRATLTDLYGNTLRQDFDALGRINGIGTGFDSFSIDYSNPLDIEVQDPSGSEIEHHTFNSFGDVLGESSSFGVDSSFNLNPGGSGTAEIDHRSTSLNVDPSGMLLSIAGGLGSRGARFDIGVDGGQLYSEVELRNKLDSPWATERTYYDESGRVVRYTHPAEDGSTATEQWSYEDEPWTVTYQPGIGPVVQTTTTTMSADGGTITVSVGGNEMIRYVRSVEAGSVKMATYLNDDSPEDPGWKEVSNEKVDPASGVRSLTPWGNAANQVTIAPSLPGQDASVQITNPLGGDNLTALLRNGLPTKISGTSNGVSVNFANITHSRGLLNGANGSIGSRSAGFAIGDDQRLSELWWPGSHPSFKYEGTSGFTLTIDDPVQSTHHTLSADPVGDLTGVSGDGVMALNVSTQDIPGGSQTTINSKVTVSTNLQGSILGRDFSGGVNESYPRNPDGSLNGISITTAGHGISATITQTPQERLTDYGGGFTIDEQFFRVGLRSSVQSPGGDRRTFTYYHLQPHGETHTGGVWNGWVVEWLPDAQDRVGTIRVTGGGQVRDFGLQYDEFSRIWKSTSAQVTATYTPNPNGDAGTLVRNDRQTAWSYDDLGRLSGVTNAGTAFSYSYPNRDAQGRITSRWANTGISWSGLQYDAQGELLSALPSSGSVMVYGYDARGNRTDQGTLATQTQINDLDQVGQRTLMSRTYGVNGMVNPDALVRVFRPQGPADGESAEVNRDTGEYRKMWDGGLGGAQILDLIVRGTLSGQGTQGADAVAERAVRVALPPSAESFSYDEAGRLKEDGYWSYTWDGPGRLTRMESKIGSLIEPGAVSEVVEFTYDAEGRRTRKTRTVLYADNRFPKLETSRVLWAGWLPVLEERTGYASGNGRRWFQWGADLSGTLEGAGGIGGLVAVIEEGGRTLLPLTDGLGNVTALINAASGQVVARYDYGPYGEPLAEAGDADACPFRWQTKWYDAESQHYYFGYRHYDPRVGRWLSRDPMGEEGGFNLYAYCGNDPVNSHDPLGLDPWGHSWGGYKPSALESVYAWALGATNYVDAKRHRALSEALGVPVTDNGSADIESARQQYVWDVDHSVDTTSTGYQERFRARINGGLEKQFAATQFGLAESQPAIDFLGAAVAFAPFGAQFMEAKSTSYSFLATSKSSLQPPIGRMVGERAPLRQLSINEKINIRSTWKELGGDNRLLRFNGVKPTGFSDPALEGDGTINIGGNVFPLDGAANGRSAMSVRSVLAHELGHVHFSGTPLSKTVSDDWRAEFGASYWAAKRAPTLLDSERTSLLEDALERAREANRSIPPDALRRIYGY